MTSDLHLEEQMEKYREEIGDQMAEEAARLIIDHTDEHSAVMAVKRLYEERQAAEEDDEVIRDDEGLVDDFLDQSLSFEKEKGDKNPAQVKAIAARIRHRFD